MCIKNLKVARISKAKKTCAFFFSNKCNNIHSEMCVKIVKGIQDTEKYIFRVRVFLLWMNNAFIFCKILLVAMYTVRVGFAQNDMESMMDCDRTNDQTRSTDDFEEQ